MEWPWFALIYVLPSISCTANLCLSLEVTHSMMHSSENLKEYKRSVKEEKRGGERGERVDL